MKRPLQEGQAATLVLNAILQQADKRWTEIWQILLPMLEEKKLGEPDREYLKFNFSIAAIAVNARLLFDVYDQKQAENIFIYMLQHLHDAFHKQNAYQPIHNAIEKYIATYNQGIIAIQAPLKNVATLLYYKMGLQNIEQKVADEPFYAAPPKIIEFLESALMLFTGKWEAINQRYDIISSGKVSTNGKIPDIAIAPPEKD